MPDRSNHRNQPSSFDTRAAHEISTVLAEVYKALKAISFYPENHPLRDEILQRAFHTLVREMKGTALSLVVRRNGLFFEDRDGGIENNRMIVALAKELFSREIQRLALLPELNFKDFTDFLTLLAMEPQKIISEGGMSRLLDQRGIQTLFVNEIDISTVFEKRKVSGTSEEDGSGGSDAPDGSGESHVVPSELPLFSSPKEPTVEELMALLKIETDDGRYRQLAQLLGAKGFVLKGEKDFDALFTVLLFLLNQNADESRSAVCRETALDLFRELALGNMADHLLEHLEADDYNRKETIYLVLHYLGGTVVGSVMKRIIATENQNVRKTLMTALLRIGPSAVQPLLELLRDDTLQTARIVTTVLGGIGGREAVRGLGEAVHFKDKRLRIEAIHSLARIGGNEATDTLVPLLQDKDHQIRRQVLYWFGITRNQKALPVLLKLIVSGMPIGKKLDMKKEALLAVGRIGDRRALEPLFKLVDSRHWITPGRWEDLKVMALETIGRIGGESTVEFLEKTVGRGGRIGRTCKVVLEKMNSTTENEND